MMVDFLEQLCQQGDSGTLFLGTKSCQSAQLAVRHGKISLSSYQGKRGLDALQLLSSLKECRFRFQQGIVAPVVDDLPDVSTILKILRVGRAVEPPSKKGRPVDAAMPERERIRILEECLAEYVGPVAGCIIEEHYNPGKELPTVIKLLAAEISTIQEAREFTAKVSSRLQAWPYDGKNLAS